jgi:hypothetical protein
MPDCKHEWSLESSDGGRIWAACDCCGERLTEIEAEALLDASTALEHERDEARAQAASMRAALEPLLVNVPLLVVDTDRIRQVLAATSEALLRAVREEQVAHAMLDVARAYYKYHYGNCSACEHQTTCPPYKAMQASKQSLAQLAAQFGEGQV